MEIITRKEAKDQGLKRYFTGIVCKQCGQISERNVYSCACRTCERIRTDKFNKQKRITHKDECNAKARILSKKARTNNPVSCILAAAKRRAKVNGLEFSITHKDVIIPTHCPINGLPLVIGSTKQSDNSPSLDRIDNTKGYIPGNVKVISWRMNRRKSDMTMSEILALAEYIRRETPE